MMQLFEGNVLLSTDNQKKSLKDQCSIVHEIQLMPDKLDGVLATVYQNDGGEKTIIEYFATDVLGQGLPATCPS